MPRARAVGGLARLLAKVYWVDTFESYWGRFGWVSVRAPGGVRLAFLALTAAAVLGLFTGRARLSVPSLRSRRVRRYLAATALATIAAHFAMNAFIMSPQGRHLFASAPQIAVLLAIGLFQLVGGERRILPLALGIGALLVAIDVYCLDAVLIPAYRPG